MRDGGTKQEIEFPCIFQFLKIYAGTMFYRITITVSCNKKVKFLFKQHKAILSFLYPAVTHITIPTRIPLQCTLYLQFYSLVSAVSAVFIGPPWLKLSVNSPSIVLTHCNRHPCNLIYSTLSRPGQSQGLLYKQPHH